MRGFNPTHNQPSDQPAEAGPQDGPQFGPQFGRRANRAFRPQRGGPHGRGPGGGRRHGHGPDHDHDHEHNGERRGPRGRTRRGEIKTVLLAILAEGPGHGYELIQRIEEKTSGAWKPSPGSVYPTLQFLEDEGLIAATTDDGKRTYDLTDEGRVEAQRRIDSPSENPWTREGRGRSDAGALFESMKGLVIALKQISSAGNPEQITAAVEIVKDARKKLYLLLAAD